MDKSKLAYIFTGTACPLNCRFCYYKTYSNTVGFSSIIQKMMKYRREGFTGVEFSGGESSISPDYTSYLTSARGLGFDRISTVTSGYNFTDVDMFKGYIDSGLNDLLISTHGYDSASYNRITGNSESMYNFESALDTAYTLNFNVRVNCIINDSIGSGFCDKYFDFISKYPNITDINFILVNNFKACTESCDSRIVAEFISDLKYKDLSNVKLRYFPYCKVDGLQCITYNYPRQVYDVMDWNVGTMADVPVDVIDREQYVIDQSRHDHYGYKDACVDCMYSEVCDGIKNGWSTTVDPIVGDYKYTVEDIECKS